MSLMKNTFTVDPGLFHYNMWYAIVRYKHQIVEVTIKSAFLPGSKEPISFSRNVDFAAQSVMPYKASSRESLF
jgi:hypothetical protein